MSPDDFSPYFIRCFRTFVGTLLLCFLAGCRSLPPMEPVDVKEAGWTIQRGQVIWNPPEARTEIVADFLLATRGDQAMVELSKAPWPLLTARIDGQDWQISSPAEDRRYRGRNKPPARLTWVWLLKAFQGESLPPFLMFTKNDTQWTFQNHRTGETMEGVLFQ